LGIWLDAGNRRKKIVKRIQLLVKEFVNIIERKSTSIKQFKYLINMVLNPKIEYIAKTSTFMPNQWDILFKPVLKPVLNMFKRKGGFASNILTNSILHPGLMGLKSF
jgi:hypothetical protein